MLFYNVTTTTAWYYLDYQAALSKNIMTSCNRCFFVCVHFTWKKLQHKATKIMYADVIVSDQGSSPCPDNEKAIVDME